MLLSSVATLEALVSASVHILRTASMLYAERMMIGAGWKKCENWISKLKRYVANLLIFSWLIVLGQLQDAVTTAHETSDAFSDETLREQAVFQYAKEAEMKEMLGNLADGQIEFYKAASIDVFPSTLR